MTAKNANAIAVSVASGLATLSGVAVLLWRLRNGRREASSDSEKRKRDAAAKSTVLLHRFDPQKGRPYGDKSISPFGMKVEVFLRMCGIPYDAPPFSLSALLSNPRRRKLPTVEVEGRTVVDSAFIIRYFCTESYGYSAVCKAALCDGELTDEQRAQGIAMKSLCEDLLYWIVGYWRYQWPEGFDVYRQINTTLHSIPWPFRWILEYVSWRGISNQLWAQGIGRYPQNEVEIMGRDALDALETVLAKHSPKQKFLFGDKPSTFDATVFAFLSSIVEIPIESPLKLYVLEREACRRYIETINELFWSVGR